MPKFVKKVYTQLKCAHETMPSLWRVTKIKDSSGNPVKECVQCYSFSDDSSRV
jgi:hypothetical protein